MSGYLVVDASVWVARLVPQDVFHQLSRTWMEARKGALSASFGLVWSLSTVPLSMAALIKAMGDGDLAGVTLYQGTPSDWRPRAPG